MSILVTGGAGFIGSHTCIELLKAVYDVVVVDNFYNSKREALRRTAELAKKIGKTEKTVYRAIKSLKENGYIVREGTDTSGYWKILK